MRKQNAPAADRNKEAICEVLRRYLPEAGTALEIASGTGQHIAHFAASFPGLNWQPSDLSAAGFGSIEAWQRDVKEGNQRIPIVLDARADSWPIDSAALVININMIHISPWSACEGLMRGSGRLLDSGGVLFMYGPYKIQGRAWAPSNEHFDQYLQSQDAAWGVRWLHEVKAEAAKNGLELIDVVEMPANNVSVVYRKQLPS